MEPLIEPITIPIAEIAPGVEDLLRANGVPPGATVSHRVVALAEEAAQRVGGLEGAVALVGELEVETFDAIYRGATDNADPTPLAGIYPRAERLALFALTLGDSISEEISAGFAANDFAMASMLDTGASLAAENAVSVLEQRFEGMQAQPELRVLSYSPGYCGWHLSGQGPLFAWLEPGRIGIALDESFLMRPLKSVSGVLVAATPEHHVFANTFEFCQLCRTKNCRERLGRLRFAPPVAGD